MLVPNRGVADDGSRRGAPNPVDLESELARRPFVSDTAEIGS